MVVTDTTHACKHDWKLNIKKFGEACTHVFQLTRLDLELRRRRHDARNYDAIETE